MNVRCFLCAPSPMEGWRWAWLDAEVDAAGLRLNWGTVSCGIYHFYGECSARLLFAKRGYFIPQDCSLQTEPWEMAQVKGSQAASLAYPARKYRNAPGPCQLILSVCVLVKMISCPCSSGYTLSSNFKKGDKENIDQHGWSSFPTRKLLQFWS